MLVYHLIVAFYLSFPVSIAETLFHASYDAFLSSICRRLILYSTESNTP